MKRSALIVFTSCIIIGMILGYFALRLLNAPSISGVSAPTPQPTAPPQLTPTTENNTIETITLTTPEGVFLAAAYYPPSHSNSPALLLLHEAYQSRRSWHKFALTAQENGYAVLSLDLRAHGESEGEEKIFDDRLDIDVGTALTWLNTSSGDINRDRIGIAGASLGANLALRAAARHPEIKSVAMLSPGMQLWAIGITNTITNYGSRPLLLVAAEEDAYPAGSVQTLNDQALGDHQLHLYPGAAHGTQLIETNPELTAVLLDWFAQTIQ